VIPLLLLLAQASRPTAPPPRGSLRAGNEAFARGDIAAAKAEYEEAVRRDPDSSAALHNLGLARLREGDFGEARADLERARAMGEEEVRFRSAYHIGHALFRESEEAERDPNGIARAIALAGAARDAFLDALERRDDADARANVELASRRIEALLKKKEEQEKRPDSQPSSQPSGEQEPDSQPSSESQPSEQPASKPSQTPESRPSEERPQSRPSPESRPQPESRPASRPAGEPESRPAVPREKVMQILDRLAELEKEREALEARIRQAQRVPVEKDW
jgi:tetratricopeptide (TPR) repeat protein